MLQKYLNHIAISDIYSELADNLDIEKLMDHVISRYSKRTTDFALSKNKS